MSKFGDTLFMLPRAFLVVLFVPMTILIYMEISQPMHAAPFIRLMGGALLVIIGAHLVLFRERHSLEHVEDMKAAAAASAPADRKLFANPMESARVRHLYSYGGVILLFMGLVLIFYR